MAAFGSTTEELADAATRRIRRYVNDATYSAAVRRGGRKMTLCHFMCECGSLACTETVAMPLAAFDPASHPGEVSAHG